jgi:hypothetical protein
MDYSYSKIEGIIFNQIFSERNIKDWEIYKNNIIQNFNNINYLSSIENYIPCQRKLYITKPKLRGIVYFRLQQLNDNIFQEVGHEQYEPRKEYKITFKEICDFVEKCVIILAKKQQGKNI